MILTPFDAIKLHDAGYAVEENVTVVVGIGSPTYVGTGEGDTIIEIGTVTAVTVRGFVTDETPTELAITLVVIVDETVPVRRPLDDSESPGTGVSKLKVTGAGVGNTFAVS